MYYILDSKKEEKECEVNFVLGEDSDDSEADTSLKHVETQTDVNALSYSPLQRIPSLSPPRSTEECLKILNSEVQFTTLCRDVFMFTYQYVVKLFKRFSFILEHVQCTTYSQFSICKFYIYRFLIFLLRYSHKMVCLNYFLPEISVFKIIIKQKKTNVFKNKNLLKIFSKPNSVNALDIDSF